MDEFYILDFEKCFVRNFHILVLCALLNVSVLFVLFESHVSINYSILECGIFIQRFMPLKQRFKVHISFPEAEGPATST